MIYQGSEDKYFMFTHPETISIGINKSKKYSLAEHLLANINDNLNNLKIIKL